MLFRHQEHARKKNIHCHPLDMQHTMAGTDTYADDEAFWHDITNHYRHLTITDILAPHDDIRILITKPGKRVNTMTFCRVPPRHRDYNRGCRQYECESIVYDNPVWEMDYPYDEYMDIDTARSCACEKALTIHMTPIPDSLWY
jgi:hypothetical protein